MNTCIKCNKPIPDGDLFCVECSKAPIAKPKKADRTHGGKFRKPRVQTSENEKSAAQKKPRRIVPIVLAVLLVIFSAISVYFFTTVTSQKVALRLREASVRSREQEYDAMTAQVADLENKIASLENELSLKDSQIETLAKSVSSAESSANQTEFDRKTQQEEFEKLQQQYDALAEENSALQAQFDEYKVSVSEQEKKAKFLDDYVVFVENDGTGYYHRYDCNHFAKKTFWAYSRKLAEGSGFAACPNCIH